MSSVEREAAAEFAWPRVRDRDVLMVFVAGLVIAVCSGIFLVRSYSDFWAAVLMVYDRSGIGAAELLAIGVLVWLVLRFRREDLLTPGDLVVIALTGLAFALPVRLAASLPLTAVGIKLLFHREPRVNSVGQVLLALAFYEWIGPVLFNLLAPGVLKVEALVAQAALIPLGGFTLDGLIISGPTDYGLAIDGGCSAFHNLSLSTLIWISLLKLDTLTVRGAHLWIAAAMAGATIVLNTARIALMAQSRAMYEFWHDGAGVPIVSFTMLAVILGICLVGLRLADGR